MRDEHPEHPCLLASTVRRRYLTSSEQETKWLYPILCPEGDEMAINMNTSGVHHVSLRVSDLKRSKKFYVDTLGFKHLMDADNICLFLAGGTAFGLRGPTDEMPKGDKFNPHRLGVDHIALACSDKAELQRVADALSAAGIENTGAKRDETLGKDYVAFKDPDRIAWEFYMA